MAIGPVLAASGSADVEAAVAAHNTLRLKGFAVSETASPMADAEVIILHGATVAAGTQVVPPVNLDPNGFGLYWFPDGGIPCPNGITIDRVAGSTTVILYVDRI